MKEKPLSFYSDLNFDDFQKLARDHNLSKHQKVGSTTWKYRLAGYPRLELGAFDLTLCRYCQSYSV